MLSWYDSRRPLKAAVGIAQNQSRRGKQALFNRGGPKQDVPEVTRSTALIEDKSASQWQHRVLLPRFVLRHAGQYLILPKSECIARLPYVGIAT